MLYIAALRLRSIDYPSRREPGVSTETPASRRLPGNRADPQRCQVKAWPGDQGRGADDCLHRDPELTAYCNGEVTVTLSKVAVPSAPALWAQVNRPIVTGSVNEIVVVPTWVQVVPSAEE